jgi:hypothetical protein
LFLCLSQIFNPLPKALNPFPQALHNVPLSLHNASEPHYQIAKLPNLGRVCSICWDWLWTTLVKASSEVDNCA